MKIIRNINKLTKLKSESFWRLAEGTFFIHWKDLKKGIDKAPIYIKTTDYETRANALNLMNRKVHCISENTECYVIDDVEIILKSNL